MNIVIAGAGKVGYFLAKELMEDNEVTLIDSNEIAIRDLEDTLDVLTISGNVEDPNLYKNIPANVDLFIAVTNSDEVNLLSALIIDNIVDVKEKIVRLRNSFFINDNIKTKLNIKYMVTPTNKVANRFKYLVDYPHISNIKIFKQTEALLLSIRAYEQFEPISVLNFIQQYNYKIIVAGIERDGNFFVPTKTEMLTPNDIIYFLAFPEMINSIREEVCNKVVKQPIKNCIIYGANQLGIEIAKVLLQKGLKIKLIDKILENCKHANNILQNNIEVIKNNYNLDSVLDTFSDDIDLFIATTDDDEFNITKCIEAKQKNIKKVIGLYNNTQYAILMRKIGIEVIRGEKISAYFSILEDIYSTKNVSQKAYCNGAGVMGIRKIDITSSLIDAKLYIDNKLYKKGIFYIIRDNKFISFEHIQNLHIDDVVVTFSKKYDAKLINTWLKQNNNE